MKNKRLKLYDNSIYTYLESSDKEKFKRIAFKNKKTISELNRSLIKIFIKLYDYYRLNDKKNINEREISDLLSEIWRDSN